MDWLSHASTNWQVFYRTRTRTVSVTVFKKVIIQLTGAISEVKYIALLAMAKIVPTHADLVSEYQDVILASIDDQDISIRMGALDLVSAMVHHSDSIVTGLL